MGHFSRVERWLRYPILKNVFCALFLVGASKVTSGRSFWIVCMKLLCPIGRLASLLPRRRLHRKVSNGNTIWTYGARRAKTPHPIIARAYRAHSRACLTPRNRQLFAAPAGGVEPRLHGSVKAGEGPTGDSGNPPMFQWIEVDVVDVVPVVALVTNQVFPIAPLPDPSLATGSLRCRQHFCFR